MRNEHHYSGYAHLRDDDYHSGCMEVAIEDMEGEKEWRVHVCLVSEGIFQWYTAECTEPIGQIVLNFDVSILIDDDDESIMNITQKDDITHQFKVTPEQIRHWVRILKDCQ